MQIQQVLARQLKVSFFTSFIYIFPFAILGAKFKSLIVTALSVLVGNLTRSKPG